MSSQTYIYQLRWPAADWIDVVSRLHRSLAFDYLYFETPTQITLQAYEAPQPDCMEGRAFGQTVELRWSRRLDGQVDLLLLSDKAVANNDPWQPCTWPANSGQVTVSIDQVILRGVSRRNKHSPYGQAENGPKAWTESRIPEPLSYPVDDTQSQERWVKLKVKIYCVDRRPLLTRMVSLEGTSDVRPI